VSEPDVVPVGPGADEEQKLAQLDVEITPDELPAEGSDDAPRATVADLEALLFVAERPLSRSELRTVCRLSAEEVDARLGDLEVQLRDRGIRLVTNGERVMLGTSPESGALIARYLGADAVRLSPAALETLAIVAYRQPVTRGVIERIRGVDSGHVVRGLLHRRLIQEQGRADSPGRPILYGSSMEFMERFGLTSLDDLPPLEAEIAAQLAQAEEDARAEAAGSTAEGQDDTGGSDGTAGDERSGAAAEPASPPDPAEPSDGAASADG
jgi:segregation and condensation protein B